MDLIEEIKGKRYGMPFEIRPTRDNVIYKEWKYWRKKVDVDFSETALAAMQSIERIAEQTYEGKCTSIVGVMIMMSDEEEMEKEEQLKQALERANHVD